MTQLCYTYRVRIRNRNNVQVEKRDTSDKLLGEPTGKFSCKGKKKSRMQSLHEMAIQNNLTEDGVKELGETLFNAMFDKGLRQDFFRLYEKVIQQKAILRLELDVDECQLPDIAALPWEFICVPADAGFGTVWFATTPNLIFSRRRARWFIPEPIQINENERLRIALVVASPSDPTLGPVKYREILKALENWAHEQKRQIELLEFVNDATLLCIDKLLAKKPHIFHFIGHARFKKVNSNDHGQIALVDVNKRPRWIEAHRFGELFNRHRPAIVLLQACEGAALSTSKAFVGIASQLVEQNIPVVTAMQYQITNSTAQRFAVEFYQRISDNDPVDKAVQEGRRQISLVTGFSKKDFATPVLFMRVRNGHLFKRPASSNLHNVEKEPKAEKVYKSLLNLNYEWQERRFRQFIEKQYRMGAILISGSEDSGTRWLVNRLVLQKPPIYKSVDKILRIDLKRIARQNNIECLWRNLGRWFGLESTNINDITIKIANELSNLQNIFLVFDNVNYMTEGYIKILIKSFWKPLVKEVKMHQPQSEKGWLLMFLIDNHGKVNNWKLNFVEQIDNCWKPELPIKLRLLNDQFSINDITRWIMDNHLFLNLSDTEIENIAEEFFNRSENGIPTYLFEEICWRLCNFSYFDEGIKRWLKL